MMDPLIEPTAALPLYFATARLGAMFVPINPRYTSEEATRVIGHADPRLVLGDRASGSGLRQS